MESDWSSNTTMLRRLGEEGFTADDSDATRPFDPDFAPDPDGLALG
jgi:hypothetical protein